MIMKNTSDKIKGRAILWKTDKGMFMDRIYTAHDSDLNLFKEFATKSNFGLKQSKIWKLILRLQMAQRLKS
jgi:hypothetical protein